MNTTTQSATPTSTIATSASALDAVRRLERELADELRAAQSDAQARIEAADADAATLLAAARRRGDDAARRAAETLLACADTDAAAAREQASRQAERLERIVERHRHQLADELYALIVPTRGTH